MAMKQVRFWIAKCDEPECKAELAMDGRLDRWDAGRNLNDEGWQTAPSYPQTFCPAHTGREVEHTTPLGSIFRDPPTGKRSGD